MDDEMKELDKRLKEERRRRFELLVGRYRNQEEAAEILGFTTDRLVSNYKKGHKKIGETIARRLESRAQLPAGTFLTPFSVPWAGHDSSQLTVVDESGNTDSILTLLNTASYPSSNAYIQSHEAWKGLTEKEIRHMSVPVDVLEKHGFRVDQLKSMTMPDNSQSTRILKGDYVAVNIKWGGIIKNDTVYAVKMGASYTLRRAMHTASGGVMLSCPNPDYPDELIPSESIDDLDILGEFAMFQGVSI